jgi:hypothetical protein
MELIMEINCENCHEDVKIGLSQVCPKCGFMMDIDEDVLVSGFDPNEDTETDNGSDGYENDWMYDCYVQEYE